MIKIGDNVVYTGIIISRYVGDYTKQVMMDNLTEFGTYKVIGTIEDYNDKPGNDWIQLIGFVSNIWFPASSFICYGEKYNLR